MKTLEELIKNVGGYPSSTIVEVLVDIRSLLIEQNKINQEILEYFKKKDVVIK
jgi:hypothetical protein